MDNKDLFYLKEFKFTNFFDYLALELDIVNNYKFSDYCRLLELISNINKYKNNRIEVNSIRTANNFKNKYDLLDLVSASYSVYSNVKLYYNKQNLLALFEYDNIYYSFFININNTSFKDYYNIFNFIGELEEYIEFTN